MNVTTTKNLSNQNGINIMIYGESGVGKTRLAHTAPSPLIISSEAGLLSLKEFDLPVLEVTTFTEFSKVLKWAYGQDQYETLYIDSLSELSEILLEEEKVTNKDARQAFGKVHERIINMVRYCRDMTSKNIIFIAKQERVAEGQTGYQKKQPSFVGRKLVDTLPHLLDEVFCLDAFQEDGKDEISRWLITQGNDHYLAKDRSGSLSFYEEPNLTNIFAKIRETKN